ncbi:tetratricopeptide repeat-containing sulfotransferase family protein [Reinekea thalattae]|uniref:Tetratricopeptide repeat protein n=1 Tax=Reinekea thalattae TaxID=2593301 RepID=A0A5C8Z8G5_9GAMM|nr:tetratricopeptide repeat-containing sulfotransferase family protein [Reinekea thalattae]TXR54202.1 tetratricopeptide repeat protein [Reinekea thalattae]
MTEAAAQQTINLALQKAENLEKSGEVGLAKTLYEHLVKTLPHVHQAWYRLGVIAENNNQLKEAAKLISNASLAKPDNFLYHRELNRIYLVIGDIEKAIISGEQATATNPKDSSSFYYYGAALQSNNDTKSAITAFTKAIKLNPQLAQGFYNLGVCYGSINDFKNAEKNYLKSLSINPNSTTVVYNLAGTYLENGNTDAAIQRFNDILNIQPDHMESHFNLSRLKKYSGNSDKHFEILKSLSREISRYSPKEQAHYWLSIGKAYEDTADIESAFEAFQTANKTYRKTFTYDTKNTKTLTSELQKIPLIKPDNQNSASNHSPIFIVGMPRSGSTLIEQILDSHSRVSGLGEIPDFQKSINTVLSKKGINYLEFLKSATNEDLNLIGEQYINSIKYKNSVSERLVNKLPNNIFNVALIYKIFPNAKIIHSLRDPMDTCMSNYKLLFNEPQPFAYDMEELGVYCRILDNLGLYWSNNLPDNFYYRIEYESLVNNLENEAKKLIDFCELEWEQNCVKFYNHKRKVKTASQHQVTKPIYTTSIKSWKKYEPYIQPMIDAYNTEIDYNL